MMAAHPELLGSPEIRPQAESDRLKVVLCEGNEAAALGVAGAALNWYYLHTKSQQLEKIAFLSIAPGATVQPGEKFSKEKLAPLAIPKDNVSEQLREEGILYADLETVRSVA